MIRRSLAVLALLTLFVAASTAQAQEQTPAPSIAGTVAAVAGTEVHLAGSMVRVDVEGADFGGGKSLADLQLGDRVQMLLSAGRPLRAIRVQILDQHDVEVSGAIEAIDTVERTITIHGVTFAVTESTDLRPVLRSVDPLSQFRVGEPATIAGSLHDGRLVAAFVASLLVPVQPVRPAIVSRPGAFEVQGTLSARDGYNWTVAGKQVLVTPRAQVRGNPQVGDQVRVTGRQFGDTLLALTVTKQ